MIRLGHPPVVLGRLRSHRRGAILVWFAVFMFAALPLMTLVVHLGMVTLTRRQMQAAVNTAAIEGLRYRDAGLVETERREQVRDVVSALFDDDLDSSNGDTMQFGAGPDIEFDSNSGIALPSTDFQASRLITNVGVWKPDPRLNTGDELHGDMVAGDYVYAPSDPDHDSHAEASTYSREDFEAQPGGDAFLVRLRRTRPSNGTAPPLDDVPEISSTGPTVPFLFGRGPHGGSAFLNGRERGTTVRATAIAHAVPALTVGPYSNDVGFGAAPIWVEQTQWDVLVTDVPVNLTISGTSLLVSGSTPFGEFVAPQVAKVGDSLVTAAPVPITEERFVPIYRVLTSGNRYVVGFGLAEFGIDPVNGGTITRRSSNIGQGNCSAHWRFNLASVPAGDLSELLAVRNSHVEPLLAPALVRAVE